jgi:hypothetical protein
MKDLEDDHLCVSCERDKRDAVESEFKRRESWQAAMNLIKIQDWPDDGRPCPEDVLRLALFLDGDN